MDQLRSHTARLTVIVLLCAGFGLYMARPAQAQQSSQDFTRWFGTMAKSTQAVDLQDEIQELVKIDGQLDKLITKASQIVSRFNDEFNFPFAESTAAQQVYQLLLIEWSQFQTGNEMAGIPVQPNVKLISSVQLDTIGAFGFIAVKPTSSSKVSKAETVNLIKQPKHRRAIIPMSSGIAICAP